MTADAMKWIPNMQRPIRAKVSNNSLAPEVGSLVGVGFAFVLVSVVISVVISVMGSGVDSGVDSGVALGEELAVELMLMTMV